MSRCLTHFNGSIPNWVQIENIKKFVEIDKKNKSNQQPVPYQKNVSLGKLTI